MPAGADAMVGAVAGGDMGGGGSAVLPAAIVLAGVGGGAAAVSLLAAGAAADPEPADEVSSEHSVRSEERQPSPMLS